MSNHDKTPAKDGLEKRASLLLAEYGSPTELATAAAKVRVAGYKAWACLTP